MVNPDAPGDKYLLLDVEGTRFYLHYSEPESQLESVNRGVEFFLKVRDVDQLARQLNEKGVSIKKGPYDLGWRPWRVIDVEDPDGCVIRLYSPEKEDGG